MKKGGLFKWAPSFHGILVEANNACPNPSTCHSHYATCILIVILNFDVAVRLSTEPSNESYKVDRKWFPDYKIRMVGLPRHKHVPNNGEYMGKLHCLDVSSDQGAHRYRDEL